MRVIDYINQANLENVASIYREYYGVHDGWGNADPLSKFKKILNERIIEQSDMRVRVYVVPPIIGDDEYISVDGVDTQDQFWSLSFVPWSQWKWMEVVDDTEKNLSIDEIVCHIYYEMTWYGWEEQAEQRRDELNDTIEQFDRDLEAGTLKLIPLDDVIKDFMKDKDSDSE